MACRDAISTPAPPTLPSFVTVDLADFDSLFVSTPAWYNFSARPFTPAGPYYVSSWDARTVATAPQVSSLFADSVLGKSFVFDCDLFHYVRDDSLHDAPADGVRIKLYWGDDSHAPLCPLDPVGYIDARDVGSPTSPALDIQVASLNGDTTFVSESLTASLSGGRYRLTGFGSLSDGVRRFDFAGTSAGVDTTNADTLSMTGVASGAQLNLVHQWTNNGGVFHLAIDVRLVHGTDTVRITGTRDLSAVEDLEDLAVSVNGTVFGSIMHLGDSVVVRGPEGRAVTAAEREAMTRLEVAAFLAPSYLSQATHPLADLLGFRTYMHY